MLRGLIRFGLAVAIVLLVVAAIDFAAGKVLNGMVPRISGKSDIDIVRVYYGLYCVKTPVVIVGSSRASHHYDPVIISDSLGLDAYNVGLDGRSLNHNCCVINSILDRYSPALIIWENGTDYLFNETNDPLEKLYPYYLKNAWVKETINEELSWTERVRLYSCLCSSLYRYNPNVHRVVFQYLKSRSMPPDTLKGFMPLTPASNAKLDLDTVPVTAHELSPTKVRHLEALLRRVQERGVKMVMVDSPKYLIIPNRDNSSSRLTRELCRKYGVMLIDNSQQPFFLKHKEYFKDDIHFNANGAKVYTEFFVRQYKDSLAAARR